MEILMYPLVAVFAILGGGSSIAIVVYLFVPTHFSVVRIFANIGYWGNG